MTIIDSLTDVQKIISDSPLHTIKIMLVGNPVEHRYPSAGIDINQQQVWQGTINDQTTLVFDQIHAVDKLTIAITYYNKTDADTKLENNQIIANQNLRIKSIEIDSVVISGNSLFEYGSTRYNLTEQKKVAYNTSGYQWDNIKTDTLWDNGTWTMDLELPLITCLLSKKSLVRHVFETPHTDVLSKLQNYFRD